MSNRTERDFMGEVEVPRGALYGIHSMRARENFPGQSTFPSTWYKAMGQIKLAFYTSIENFISTLNQEYPNQDWPFKLPTCEIVEALKAAAAEVADGKQFEQFIVPAIQGGAGTSINMNINEIITNLALQQLNSRPGEYSLIDPIEEANLFQSTNDTVGSALRIAAMNQLGQLETAINQVRHSLEKKEAQYRTVLRIGYTQYQEAVPTTFGRLFSNYTDALSRDWWRISKGKERIKVLNIGGSAIGTGLTVPRYVIMVLIDHLRSITNLPVSRSENMSDATANHDDLVELHGLLKALAVNLEKLSGDLRILSSDLSGEQGFNIPARQAGSSIMPGKVNPVIPEFVISSCHQVYANDAIITNLAAQGNLELNPYLPQIGISLLNSLDLLTHACHSLSTNCVDGIQINKQQQHQKVLHSPSLSTALIPVIGYHKASELVQYMKTHACSIIEANLELQLIDNELLSKYIDVGNLMQLGFSVKTLPS